MKDQVMIDKYTKRPDKTIRSFCMRKNAFFLELTEINFSKKIGISKVKKSIRKEKQHER